MNVRLLAAVIPMILLGFAPLLSAGTLLSQEKEEEPPLVTPANGLSIKLEGQVQVQFASTTVDSVVTWDTDLRRMRITAVGEAGNDFSGTLQTDFGQDRVRIRDAFFEWKATPFFTLRAGQFKVPFNGIETVSSKRLLMVERSHRIRGLSRQTGTSDFLADNRLSARQRGFMGILRLHDERLVIQGGGWTGSGEATETDDGKELALRVEYSVLPLPEKDSRPLVVGAAAITNGYFGEPRDTLRVVEGDSIVVEDPQYAAAFEGWIEYGRYLAPGLHVAANVIGGDNPARLRVAGEDFDFKTFLGLQGWGEFLLETGGELLTAWAPAFRADRFDPDTDAEDDANLTLTPGLNVYFGKNVKTQVNLDLLVPDADEAETHSAFRFQTQVLF